MPFRKALTIFLVFIPTLLAFVGQATRLPVWLVTNITWLRQVEPDVLKDWSLGVGTAISGLLVALRMLYLETRHEKDQQTFSQMLKLWRDVLTGFLRASMGDERFSVSIRVLRPKKWHEKRTIADWRGQRIEFKVVHLESLSGDPEPKGLCFEMWPNPQGVAGRAFASKDSQYEVDARTSQTDYGLTKFQQQALNNVRFVLCVPIVDENNRVLYIVSIDSASPLKIPSPVKEQKIVNGVINYLTLAKQIIPIIARKS